MRTKQDLFSEIWLKLNSQGVPARSAEDMCQYRTSTGLACAVGCLLDDRTAATLQMSLGSISKLKESHHRLVPDWLVKNKQFLTDMQELHDRTGVINWLDTWKNKMQNYATVHDLVIPSERSL